MGGGENADRQTLRLLRGLRLSDEMDFGAAMYDEPTKMRPSIIAVEPECFQFTSNCIIFLYLFGSYDASATNAPSGGRSPLV